MDLSIAEFKQFSPLFEQDILEAITVETCVDARNSYGGTSSTGVQRELVVAEEILGKQRKILDMFTTGNI
jgi:argininosuccinate lyase